MTWRVKPRISPHTRNIGSPHWRPLVCRRACKPGVPRRNLRPALPGAFRLRLARNAIACHANLENLRHTAAVHLAQVARRAITAQNWGQRARRCSARQKWMRVPRANSAPLVPSWPLFVMRAVQVNIRPPQAWNHARHVLLGSIRRSHPQLPASLVRRANFNFTQPEQCVSSSFT